MTLGNGQDLVQQSALLLLTTQLLLMLPLPPRLLLPPPPPKLPKLLPKLLLLLLLRLALPPLPPHTLRFGEMEPGQSTRSAEPGPKSLSVPCLAEEKTE